MLFAGRNWFPLSSCLVCTLCSTSTFCLVSYFFGVCRFVRLRFGLQPYIFATCAQTRTRHSCSILIFLYNQFLKEKKSNLKELRRRDPSFPFLSTAAAAVAVSFLATFVAFHSVDNQTTSPLCSSSAVIAPARPSLVSLQVYISSHTHGLS